MIILSDCDIEKEEIFGRVTCLFKLDTLDSILELANDSEFGLSASVWGKDINRCLEIADGLEAGIVQVNQNAVMLPGIAYGGVKNSGVGAESSLEAMINS